MATIDLGPPQPSPQDLLDGLPRRVTLTLPELRYVADKAGNAPLPFDGTDDAAADATDAPALDDRLGEGRADRAAYAAALARLPEPSSTLARRGLLVGEPGGVDDGLIGAVGLLATPTVAVDIDVTAGGVQAKSWHRQAGGAVAALSTQDGIVFELAWFPTWSWAAELARVAVVPEELPLHESRVPGRVDMPHELVDAAGEAARSHRTDVIPVLVAQHSGRVTDEAGERLTDPEVTRLLTALGEESQGRLRALVADVSGSRLTNVGVVAWTLVADGWRSLRPHEVAGRLHIELARVIPEALAGDLAPVVAQVLAGTR
jgi:hypothetical protein